MSGTQRDNFNPQGEVDSAPCESDGRLRLLPVSTAEDIFRIVFRDAPEAMGLTDAQGHYLAVNKSFCDFLGYTEEELLRKSILSISHPEELPSTLERLRTVNSATGSVRFQKRYLHKRGHVRWGDVSRSVICDKDGKPAFMVAQIVDITERKRTEAALRKNEQCLRVALNTAEQQLRFDMLLTDISTRFVNVPADEIDHEIERALESICKSLSIEHSSIHQMKADDPSTFVMTHIFRDPALPQPPKNMNAKQFFPWCLNRVLANEIVSVPNTREAPAEASVDISSWKQFGIRSTLVIPLAAGGRKPVGCWGIDSVGRQHDWQEPLARRLRLVADVFANALERKHAEEKLLESEARLRMAAEAANAGFWTLNLDTSTLWTTSTTKQLFGLADSDDFDYEKFLGLIHPDDREGVQRIILSSTKGQEFVHEYRIFRPDGTARWMLSRGSRHSRRGGDNNTLMGITVDVTDRKRMEQELRRRESELGDAQRLARVGSWTRDGDTDVLTWSDEMYRIHGLDPSCGPPNVESLRKLFTPESWNRLRASREQAWRTGSVPNEDLEFIRPDGSHGWISTRGEIERDASGRILRVRGTAQDITERKTAEARLREYEHAIESVEEMIAVVDREYRYVIVNRAFLAQHNLAREQAIGRFVAEILGTAAFENSIKKHLDESFEGNIVRFEMKYAYPRNGIRHLFISYFPVQGPTGIDRVACILQDITERRQAEEALQESEARFRRVVEHIGDALIVDDVDGRVVYANDRFLELFGFRREELSTLALENYVCPDWRTELRDRHDRRMRGEHVPTHFEYEGQRRNGRRMWLEVDIVSIAGADGKITGTQSAIRDITVRKRLDEELRRRESQLREAQRIAHLGGWTVDANNDKVTWSEELIALVGWDPKVPIPTWKEHAQFFSADTWDILNEAHREALLTGRPFEIDAEGIRVDGTKAWFTTRGEAVRDSHGNIDHLRGTIQDITDRKIAEQALRESEGRYRSLVESSHDWIWEVDANGRYTYVGPQCRRIFGYEPEEILGRKPFDLMPTEEATKIAEAFEQIAKERKPFRALENVNLHKDGRLLVIETNGTPILDGRGELIGYRGMDRDITRSKRAEQALIQSEKKFATLFRAAPAAIGLNTLDGTFVDVNHAFEAVTGYSRMEAVGHTARDFGLWVEPDKSEELRRLSEKGAVRGIEHRFRTKKGDVRTGIVSADLIDISGEKYILTAIGDVTEQKEAEKIQRELSGRLIRAQEDERKRIARELHDDINQRVALLAVQLQQLQGLPAQERKRIEKLFKETTEIASDIQALSHKLHSANLDYLGLVPAIQGFCDDLARKQNIKVNFTHSGVPNSISTDVDLALFRITQEALHNAVKYSGEKQFEVNLAGTSEYAELIVRDAGVGFGPEAAMHGRGLGLIGMRERIVPLKGRISIVSKPKHGTEITVRIPWAQSHHSG